MLKMNAIVLKTKKELLERGTKYAPYTATCYVPWMNRAFNVPGITAEQALLHLAVRISRTMTFVEDATEHEIEVYCADSTAAKALEEKVKP
jgi:hypothetical protein